MLLQVHDELIFEAPEKEVDATAKLVRGGDGKSGAAGGGNFSAAGGRSPRRRQLGRGALALASTPSMDFRPVSAVMPTLFSSAISSAIAASAAIAVAIWLGAGEIAGEKARLAR